MKEDLEFLAGLNKRLHFVTETHGSGHWETHTVNNDEYTNRRMNKEEAERVLNISKQPEYVIYPIVACSPSPVRYNVSVIHKGGKEKRILSFKESQLPKRYTFEKMSKTFMNKENLKKAELIGEEIKNDRDYYEYS